MKYGLYLPNFGAFGDVHLLVEVAQEAEEAGWDGFFLWDHLADWNLPMVDPWVALAAVAAHTDRIRIGTTVTPLPRRRPWKVARETVTLDHLSGGRVNLSVGSGGGGLEWEGLGEQADHRLRGEMLDEALTILDGLWRGEPFSFKGAHYQMDEVCFTPEPLQSPRIPVWVGGNWPHRKPFRRAARWDGVFPLFNYKLSLEEELQQFDDMITFVHSLRGDAAGPFDVIMMGVSPVEDRAGAAALVAQYTALGATWWLELLYPYSYGADINDPWPVDAMRARIRQGPPH
jgi:alkanesulfonate monooxygenase SsuD/methylene tetrahydromethanopterin reductase-like flavin-dependent oxidoreductase (luciferase family)